VAELHGLTQAAEIPRHIVARPRLMSLLDQAATRVVLLVAPAGYGKTTLLRQWLKQRELNAVCYQAKPSSADVAALASDIADLARSAFGFECARTEQRLRLSPDPAGEASALARLTAADLDEWPSGVWFVLDDHHALGSSDRADDFLQTFVAMAQFPVMISGRERPRWVSTRDILYGDVLEIGQSALAMTHSEAADALGRSAKGEELTGLVALADGWPAVIGLACLTSGSFELADGVVPEALYDFFAEELYRELDAQFQVDVCSLALASAINLRLASALFGERASGVLEHGERKGFLARQDAHYELHPLLRQFLVIKLKELDAGPMQEVAERICQWETAEGHLDEAFELACRYHLSDAMFKVIDTGLDDMLANGRVASVQRWVDVARQFDPLSSTVLLSDLELSFRRHQWDVARAHALRLTAMLAPEDPRMSRALHRIGQIGQLDDRYDEAVAYLVRARETAQTNQDLRAALSSEFFVASDYGDQDRAREIVTELKAIPGATADELIRICQAELHLAARWGGVDRELRKQAASLALVDHSSDPVVRTGFLQTFGATLVLAARYEDAARVAERHIAEVIDAGLEWALPHALELRGWAEWGLREFDRAHATVREALRVAIAQDDLHAKLNAAVLLARIQIVQGAPDRAVETTQLDVERVPNPSMQGDFLAIRALGYALIGERGAATRLAKDAELWTDHIDVRIGCFFVRAICGLLEGENGSDRGALEVALEAARDTEVYDGFVLAYRAYPPLLRALAELNSPAASACKSRILAVDRRLAERAGIVPRSLRDISAGPLTSREHEVLDLVQRGLANREIAATLWIAESTAKKHVHNVFKKLGVRSRAEAAALAKRWQSSASSDGDRREGTAQIIRREIE
jgi:LuxR family maltose regulon positive regulatory protein